MTLSMTAFARSESTHPHGNLVWELRSVNHRYLDLSLKLPDELRALEPDCRARLTERLKRGRVDANLKFERTAKYATKLQLNYAMLDALATALSDIEAHLPQIRSRAHSLDFLRWPGVLRDTQMDVPGLSQLGLGTLERGLDSLVENRHREGHRLAALIAARIADCRRIVAELESNLAEIEQQVQQRWQARLATLQLTLEPARLGQEIALSLSKIDVREELERLQGHCDEVEAILAGAKPAGRRLDFLMQEMQREANTLGAKSAHTHSTRAGIDLKVLIDQMREQVQNIE